MQAKLFVVSDVSFSSPSGHACKSGFGFEEVWLFVSLVLHTCGVRQSQSHFFRVVLVLEVLASEPPWPRLRPNRRGLSTTLRPPFCGARLPRRQVAASLPVPLPARRSLGDEIEGDECSSRTASEAELGQPTSSRPSLSAAGLGGGDGGSSSSPFPSPCPSPGKNSNSVLFRLAVGGAADAEGAGERAPPRAGSPAGPVPTASSLAALARAATASTCPAQGGGPGEEGFPEGGGAGEVYCSSPEESDFGDDEGGGGGGFEGGGSQAGFWYRDGGGASALEAAMGQWGDDDLGSAAAAPGAGREDDGDTGSDTTAPTVMAPTAGEGEDESWEIVNPPRHWEADATVSQDCFRSFFAFPTLVCPLLRNEVNFRRPSQPEVKVSIRTPCQPISFCIGVPPAPARGRFSESGANRGCNANRLFTCHASGG